MRQFLIILAISVAIPASPLNAQQYGTTDFPASGDPQAHPLFIRGLVMLHNFEYEDAP